MRLDLIGSSGVGVGFEALSHVMRFVLEQITGCCEQKADGIGGAAAIQKRTTAAQFQLHCVFNRLWGGQPSVTQLSLITLLHYFHGKSDLSPKLIFEHIFGTQPTWSLGLAVLRCGMGSWGLKQPECQSFNFIVRTNKQCYISGEISTLLHPIKFVLFHSY